MSIFRDYAKEIIRIDDKEYTIDRNTRFFVKMVKQDIINFPGIGLMYFGKTYGINNNNEEWTECYINEDEYLVNFGSEKDSPYKIKLTACDQAFGSETYYYQDFISLIKSGHILIKENEFQRPVPYRFVTNIPNSCATIVEEGTVVVDIRNYI